MRSQALQKFRSLVFSETGFLENAHRDVLPVGRTLEAPFENKVSLDWVCNARRLSDVFWRIASKHPSVFSFLQVSWYQLVIVRIPASSLKTSNPYNALVDIALHLTLCGIFFRHFKQIRGVKVCFLHEQWLWNIFPLRDRNGDYGPEFRGLGKLSKCVRLYKKGHCATKRSSHFLYEEFFPSCKASYIYFSQMQRLFMWRQTGLFRTLSSISMLSQWTSPASIEALCSKRLQRTCFKSSGMKTFPALGFREKRAAQHLDRMDYVAAQLG